MVRQWNQFINIGVKPELPTAEVRKIRLLNGILGIGEILVLLLILKSIFSGLPHEYTVQSIGAFLFMVPVILNYFGKYKAARVLCIIIPILYLSFLTFYWGSTRGSQLIIFAVTGLAVLFFDKKWTIALMVSFASMAIIVVEVYNFNNLPLYTTANVEGAYLINVVITIVMLVTIMSIFKKENNTYHERMDHTNREISGEHKKVVKLNQELSQSLKIIHQQKSAIDEAHTHLQDSINYANVIQQSMLKVADEIVQSLPEHFILFQAKNVVSGDFYYLYSRGDLVYIAVVDCTGHGVPGAFMSMIGRSLLQEAIETELLEDPADILTFLNAKIHNSLKQETLPNPDGMDAGLVIFNKNTYEIQFAGAKIELILFNSKGYNRIKGDRVSIGGYTPENYQFASQRIQLAPVDMIYLYTDGYQDQFGGKDNKKIRSTNLIDQLFGIQNEPMDIQKQRLLEYFMSWKGKNEQTDDVLVFGMRV